VGENKERQSLEQMEHIVIEKLARIETKVDTLKNDFMKMIAGLVGIIAANIGLKFVGTPWYVIVCVYMSIFAGVFLLASILLQWKVLTNLDKVIRTVFALFILYSSFCREFLFDVSTGVPLWYTPIVDIFLTGICILLIVRVWNQKRKEAKH
jgi:hypothetical protein